MKKAFYFITALCCLFALCGEIRDVDLVWVVAYYAGFLFLLLFCLRRLGIFKDVTPYFYTFGATTPEQGERLKDELRKRGCKDIELWLYHKPGGGIFFYCVDDKIIKHTTEQALIEHITNNGEQIKF